MPLQGAARLLCGPQEHAPLSRLVPLQLEVPLLAVSALQALDVLSNADGVSIINDRQQNRFPTPLDASNQDDVYVGRVRRDISRDDNRGLDLFVCGDQIKKGAALNAVQIAELLL